MRHLDLFSGIGGFAYAIDQAWSGVEHVFCDNEPFAQQVLKRHWPESKIYGDIRELKTKKKFDIVTGGFPCQPFSSAGKRGGSEDDRFLWPEMLRVIRSAQPEWVVAENVYGIVTIEDGLVFEQACADLEATGYQVQPFVIPACATNAIHRRDRIWIVAHDASKRRQKRSVYTGAVGQSTQEAPRQWDDFWVQPVGSNLVEFRQEDEPFICGMDDGLPDRVDRIKALGNSIVPQVAIQIMKAIKEAA